MAVLKWIDGKWVKVIVIKKESDKPEWKKLGDGGDGWHHWKHRRDFDGQHWLRLGPPVPAPVVTVATVAVTSSKKCAEDGCED